jgi:hypothetical protein
LKINVEAKKRPKIFKNPKNRAAFDQKAARPFVLRFGWWLIVDPKN